MRKREHKGEPWKGQMSSLEFIVAEIEMARWSK